MNSLTNRDPQLFSGRDVTAVLGPTNTGKTHLAIERMVAHESGVIGLPLRLLAREVYGRVATKVGPAHVALVTGEEKIVPENARYAVCTVEAMPRETDAAFVAIDEVQLAGDLERGHMFTDRILNLRGRIETLLLGAGTMAPILKSMLPGISIVERPRMSHLAYAGSKKITRLPRRTAIVAFSANEVYAIAELIRRQRGGAAVVMGALSPRTRNAQVALYQNGDVDYLVATDAIGMGLNLDVDHVAFAQDTKFDGHQFRRLTPAEMAQIAGRAGRHVNDGTFGVTGRVAPLEHDLVEAVESHQFDPVKVMQWRNRELDMGSVDRLLDSLNQTPRTVGLSRALPAVDQRALELLIRDHDVMALCQSPDQVQLLWDVCALPDYRKIAPAQHADIIAQVYMDIVRHGHIDENYMAQQVRRADRTDGEIDTLSHRIAQVRTWTYIANRPGWLADPQHWQQKTRQVEDKLSDALHERLTKRFVDRRTSVLMKRLKENTRMEAEINPDGAVSVEGHHVGKLDGFRFSPDSSGTGEDAKAVKAAAHKALAGEFDTRATRFGAAANGDFALGNDGILRWLGAPVASLSTSEDWLRPRVILLADEQLTGPALEKVQQRAERFVTHHIETLLKPLTDMRLADELSGMARGIAFRLIENFGIVERRDIADDVKALDQDSRAALRRYGVRFGFYHVFIPALIKPAPSGVLTMLWALAHDGKDRTGFGDVVAVLAAGRTSVVVDPAFDPVFYRLAGYRMLGPRAVRVDILERLADLIRPALFWKEGKDQPVPDGAFGGGKFVVTPAMLSILGATVDDIEQVLKSLGYVSEAMSADSVAAKLESLKPVNSDPQPSAVAKEPAKGDQSVDLSAVEPDAVEAVGTSETSSVSAPPTQVDRAADETPAQDEEQKTLLVWRQGRAVGKHNRDRSKSRHAKNGQERQGRGNTKGQSDQRNRKRDGKDSSRPAASARPPRKREAPIDQDSPFAKLQALKDQMKT